MHSLFEISPYVGFVLQSVVILLAGAASGLINVTAGGGSMIALPVLIFAGLDPVTANGTNRISTAVMGATAVYGFHQKGLGDFKLSTKLAAWALPGAVFGAFVATQISNDALQQVISVVLILCVITLLVPMRPAKVEAISRLRWWAAYPTMFIIGFYGGFIQVGASFVFMIGLQRLLRMDLVTANVHKVLITFIYTLPALAIFVWTGQVNWFLGVILAVGTAGGAWLGTRVAIRGGERWIRIIVAVVVVMMAGKLLLSV